MDAVVMLLGYAILPLIPVLAVSYYVGKERADRVRSEAENV